jgi:hypothetical protein
MPHYSELSPRVEITDTSGAISLVTQHSGSAGHSMVAIEYLQDARVENVVAHLVALPSTNVGKPTQAELISGSRGGARLKTRILIQSEGSIRKKIASKLDCTSLTWSAPNSKLNLALELIGRDASLSDTRNEARKDTTAQDYQTSPNDYVFLGRLSVLDPQFGINCANWAVSVLEAAGIRNVGGMLLDIPSRLTAGGRPTLRAKL